MTPLPDLIKIVISAFWGKDYFNYCEHKITIASTILNYLASKLPQRNITLDGHISFDLAKKEHGYQVTSTWSMF
jgi:hypothetical protein